MPRAVSPDATTTGPVCAEALAAVNVSADTSAQIKTADRRDVLTNLLTVGTPLTTLSACAVSRKRNAGGERPREQEEEADEADRGRQQHRGGDARPAEPAREDAVAQRADPDGADEEDGGEGRAREEQEPRRLEQAVRVGVEGEQLVAGGRRGRARGRVPVRTSVA